MTYRKRNHEKPIVSLVSEEKGATWSEETRKVVATDAQRILEALVAELGVDKCIAALDSQGFKGSAYTYLLNPLFNEAIRRRHASEIGRDDQDA